MKSILFAICTVLSLAYGPAEVHAQDYPTRLVTLVAPVPAGGNVDRVARVLAPRLSEKWKQPVIVSNVVGGSNMIGTKQVAKSQPDGYTILVGSLGPNVLTPLARKQSGIVDDFDPQRDLKPIVNISKQVFFMLVPAQKPYKTAKDLFDAMRLHGDEMNYATSGLGTVSAYGTESIKKQVGGSMVMVPYRGDAPAVTALMSAEVDAYYTVASSAIGLIKSGRARALFVSSAERSKLAPDVPSLKELGLERSSLNLWIGLFGPAKMPEAIARKINEDVQAILKEPAVRAVLEQGQEIMTGSVEDYNQFLRGEFEKFQLGVKEIDFRSE